MPDKTFADECLERIERYRKKIQILYEQILLYNKLVKEIPDVYGSWNHGCVSTYEILESPIFYSNMVNKNYDELSFGGAGCCHESWGNPYFVRPIKIVNEQRIRGTIKVCVARYNDYGDGYLAEDGWRREVGENYGIDAIQIVKNFLDNNPYKPYDDEEDDDDN